MYMMVLIHTRIRSSKCLNNRRNVWHLVLQIKCIAYAAFLLLCAIDFATKITIFKSNE